MRIPASLRTGCGKCSNQLLVREIEYNQVDSVEVLKCSLCGWRKYGEPQAAAYQDLPLETVKGEGYRNNHTAGLMTRTCSVIDCGTSIRHDNASGLCFTCYTRNRAWQKSTHITQPPFLPSPDQPGRLIKNPLSGQRLRRSENAPVTPEPVEIQPDPIVVTPPPATLPPVTIGWTCAVKNCDTRINAKANKTGLCSLCQHTWRIWRDGQQLTPPPFIADPDRPGKLKKNPAKCGARTNRKELQPCLNVC